uniref:SNTX MACPF/CDC-like domain-containing protein n=1 Tax=Acrobeloides nanus TaxID=290746 RepID=A0A914E1M0_9BILA
MPKRVSEIEGGKGKKLFFHLIPLSVMKKQLGIQLGPEAILCSIERSILTDLQRIFDEFEESDEELRDLENLFQRNTSYLLPNELARLIDFQHEFNKYRDDFNKEVAQKLHQVRSGQAEIETLGKLIADHRTNIYVTHTKVIEFIQTFKESVERIKFLQEILKDGVHYVDRAQNFSKLQFRHAEMIVLYFSFNNANYELSRKFECQKEKKDENSVFVFVDVDRIENISQVIPEKGLNSFNGLFRYSQGKYSNLEIKQYSKAEIGLSYLEAVQRKKLDREDDHLKMIIKLQEYLQTGSSDEELFKKILGEDLFILIEAFHKALEAFSLGSHDTPEIMNTLKEKYYKFNSYGQSPDLLQIIYGKDFEDDIESAEKTEFKDIPNELIISDNNYSLTSDFVMSNKASDKISKLGVKEELQLSVLCGVVSVGGSAKYIEEHKPSKKAVQCSFVQKIRTVDESINIKHVGLRDSYSKTIGEDGTHVVFKISWGANATVTLTYENEENLAHREIQDELKLKLEKIKSFVDIPMLPEQSSGNMESNKILKNEQLNFYFNADVMPNDEGAPRTLDKALEFIRNMPKLVSEGEKGKKLFFHLIPLSVMKKHLGIQLGPEAILCSIQSSILKDLQRVFDELEESDEELRDLEKLFQQNTPHLHQNELARLKDFQHEFNKFRNDFKGAVDQNLRQVRSGQAEIETLKKLIVDHRTNIYATHTKVTEFIQTFNKSVERLELLQEILKDGVQYVDCAQNFSKLQSKYVEMIVLYLSFNNANYELSRKFECQKKNKDKNPVFVFVDVDRIENIGQIIPEKELNSFNGLFRYSQGKYSNLEALANNRWIFY